MNQETSAASIATVAPQTYFSIQRIFLKGISLELPLGSHLFRETGTPALNLAVQVEKAKLADNVHEVTLRGTLTTTLGDKTLFLLEVEQAGIFEVRDAPDQQLADILDIGAPSILAPYLRAQLADALTRATLPVFYMPEINWPALAMERRTQAAGTPVETSKQIH